MIASEDERSATALEDTANTSLNRVARTCRIVANRNISDVLQNPGRGEIVAALVPPITGWGPQRSSDAGGRSSRASLE
jgi:hypothetical protein